MKETIFIARWHNRSCYYYTVNSREKAICTEVAILHKWNYVHETSPWDFFSYIDKRVVETDEITVDAIIAFKRSLPQSTMYTRSSFKKRQWAFSIKIQILVFSTRAKTQWEANYTGRLSGKQERIVWLKISLRVVFLRKLATFLQGERTATG